MNQDTKKISYVQAQRNLFHVLTRTAYSICEHYTKCCLSFQYFDFHHGLQNLQGMKLSVNKTFFIDLHATGKFL